MSGPIRHEGHAHTPHRRHHLQEKKDRNYTGTYPHALTGDGTNTYSYDANGSMTNRSDGRVISYDGLNRIKIVSDDGSYVYDGGYQLMILFYR